MPSLNIYLPFALAAFVALAGCGADGAPEAPSKSGFTISGEAAIGITTK